MNRIVTIKKALLFFLIILLTSCVGRVDILYDAIFIEENGALVNAHKSSIDIPNDGGETVIKVIFPWSTKLSLSHEEADSWLDASIIPSADPVEYPTTDNRLKADVYYVTYVKIEAQRNGSNTRTSTLSISCPLRDDICKAEIAVKQR